MADIPKTTRAGCVLVFGAVCFVSIQQKTVKEREIQGVSMLAR
jgi:hypothetical protein